MISQIQENNCSPNEPCVVVLEKGFFLNEISPFGVDFEIFYFVDLFMLSNLIYLIMFGKQTHSVSLNLD